MSASEELSERFRSLQYEDGAYQGISRYLVAIDFGTKFSAAAVVQVRLPPESRETNSTPKIQLSNISVIESYPGRYNSKERAQEAPSVSIYCGKKHVAWGWQIGDYEDDLETEDTSYVRIDLAKLLLDETERSKDVRAKLAIQLNALGLTPVNVIADYLRDLYRHIEERIACYDTAENRVIEVVLCVPALWSPLAHSNMRLAACRAGMTVKEEHGVISEPEAVAAFLLEKHQSSLAVDSNRLIVVCDSGGGTADVTTMNVVSPEPLILTQAAAPDGDLCGSVFLDHAFEACLRKRLEHAKSYLSEKKREKWIRRAVKEFADRIKLSFEVGRNRGLCVKVEGLRRSPEHNFRDSLVDFSEQEIKDIFDRIVQRNIDLVARQITSYITTARREGKPAKRVQYIFFVGGLAGSPYVEKAFRRFFWEKERMGYPICVVTPSQDGATALVQGALLLASKRAIIKEARIRQSYGITRIEPYQKSRHHTSTWKWDKFQGQRVVHNRIKWIVQKEEIIASGPDVPYIGRSGEMHFDVKLDDSFDFEQILWRSDKRIADSVHLKNHKKDVTMAYKLTFNLADAVDAREEKEYPSRKDSECPVAKHNSLVKELVKAQWETGPSEADEGQEPDLTENANAGSTSYTTRKSDASAGNMFYRIRYEVVIRIVGTEMTFNIVAPPGGPVRKSATFSVASDLRDIEEEL